MTAHVRPVGGPDRRSANGGGAAAAAPPTAGDGRQARRATRALLTADPSTRCRAAVRALVEELRRDVDGLAQEMALELHRLAPDIEHGEDALEATRMSCRANMLMLFDQLSQPAGRRAGGVPTEALARAQEFVRQGVALTTLQRLYRIGHAFIWRAWLDLAMARLDDRTLLTEVLDHWNTVSFTYIDTVLDRLTTEYAEERERWVRSAAAMRVDTVRAILSGAPVDAEAAGRRLHYALGQRHVAFVLWDDGASAGNSAPQAALERAALRRVGALGTVSTLLVPLGADVVAGWVGVHRDVDLGSVSTVQPSAEEPAGTRIAFGSIGAGIDGFRASHEEALVARRVACLLPHGAPAVTRYADVALLGLLTQDMERARHFAVRELGRLARDDPATGRLRETVRLYFEEGLSPARVARRLGIHENTAAYRLRRAEELLGRPLAERRSELVAAITLADIVGRTPAARD